MRKLTVALSLLFSSFYAKADIQETYQVNQSEIRGGYITKKVWLAHYAMPEVQLTNVLYATSDIAGGSTAGRVEVLMGKERKRPFAIIRIPAFSQNGQRMASFTLSVNEQGPRTTLSARKVTASSSVLAGGTWHKIAINSTGLYKVDFDFVVNKLGIPASAVNLANIRVFGSGGNMLPEKNSSETNPGLTENAIWVNDNDGNGSFSPGDYFVFYGRGPVSWHADSAQGIFTHATNLYDDKGYYFLNFDLGPGLRIGSQDGSPTGNVTVNQYNDYHVHETELYNPGQLGKKWWGDDFGTIGGRPASRSLNFNLGQVSEATFRINVGSRSLSDNNMFVLSLDGQQRESLPLHSAGKDAEDTPVMSGMAVWKMPYSNSNPTIDIAYQGGTSEAVGYLDFVEINTRRALAFADPHFAFRDLQSVGAGKIATYQIGNANNSTQVWDVTDPHQPVKMNGTLNGNTYSFSQSAETLHEFAALNNSSLPTPEYAGKIDNQDIIGTSPIDYIIVAYPDFVNEANSLADFHRQRGLRVMVATTAQVYNEFSSGGQDISAIRDYARLFYDRAEDSTQMPRYLLLFGDASYDYKNRIANNTNFVPTFESNESHIVISSYCNDDFFSFLDDNEDIENVSIPNTMDIGVGRLPVKTKEEAIAVVNKIQVYKSPASLGPWRLTTTLVADDEDNAGPHMEDGEVMDQVITRNSNIYNGVKVYEDALETVSTPGGQRAPEANKAINDQIFKGTLLLNYNGHGNTQVLSHERILTQDDYNKWKNLERLPFMVTATCDFGRFDHPDYVSAGERIFLKGDGGVIATLTTTQLVYQYANRLINQEFLNAQFKHINGHWNTFGDALRIGKNSMYLFPDSFRSDVIINIRKFALLGDPALVPNFPEYFMSTDSILDGATMQPVDSIGALGEYVIKGSVTDVNGSVLNDFNGRATVTFFDKPKKLEVTTYNGAKSFNVRNNIIYKGKATVTNGKYSISFIAPKDINYDFGKGKLSYYAENGSTDGAGADTSFVVGGFSDNPVIEFDAPIVKPFIGDSLFKNGGLTGANTLLFVILHDATGINVSGNSVGHDLTAVLDGDVANPYILNDYYETAPNTYKKGYVSFPLANIPDGKHRITVKAWDVNNNSGEGYVDFEVANGNVVKVQNLINYPNPFRDKTHFRFEHNHPDETLTTEIQIYNTSGALVRRLKQTFEPTGSHSDEITWDGTADNGAILPAGVYIYRMSIATEKGIQTMAYQKLVLVR